MRRLLALTVAAAHLSVPVAVFAGDPFLSRNPSGPHTYDIFQHDRRVGTIRPDALGKPTVEGVSPREHSRYTILRSPSAPGAYEVLRDGKRIGTVVSPAPPSPREPVVVPRPGADRLEVPGAAPEGLDLERGPGEVLERR